MEAQRIIKIGLTVITSAGIFFGCQESTKVKTVGARLIAPRQLTSITPRQLTSITSRSTSIAPRRSAVVDTARKQATKEDLDKVLARFKAPTQNFQLTTAADTLFVGKQGTRVHVQLSDFTTEDGTTILGPVNMSLVECYSPLEMFAHQLSTHTLDKRILETGGSVRILAQAGGKSLRLKPGEKIEIDFPVKNGYQEGMQEFKGVANAEGAVEWQNEEVNQQALIQNQAMISSLESYALEFPVNVNGLQQTLIMTKNERSTVDLRELALKSGEANLGFFIGSQELINTDLGAVFAATPKMEVSVYFNRRGKVKDIKSTRLVSTTTLETLLRFFRKAPPVQMEELKPNKGYVITLESKQSVNSKQYYASKGGAGYVMNPTPEQKLVQKVYSLQVDWLGWVNCDRYAFDKRQKVQVGAKIGAVATVFLICKRIRSRMFPSSDGKGNFTFYNLPVDEPVRLVAIAVKDDEVYLETRDFNVANKNEMYAFDPQNHTTDEGIVEAFKL